MKYKIFFVIMLLSFSGMVVSGGVFLYHAWQWYKSPDGSDLSWKLFDMILFDYIRVMVFGLVAKISLKLAS